MSKRNRALKFVNHIIDIDGIYQLVVGVEVIQKDAQNENVVVFDSSQKATILAFRTQYVDQETLQVIEPKALFDANTIFYHAINSRVRYRIVQ